MKRRSLIAAAVGALCGAGAHGMPLFGAKPLRVTGTITAHFPSVRYQPEKVYGIYIDHRYDDLHYSYQTKLPGGDWVTVSGISKDGTIPIGPGTLIVDGKEAGQVVSGSISLKS